MQYTEIVLCKQRALQNKQSERLFNSDTVSLLELITGHVAEQTKFCVPVPEFFLNKCRQNANGNLVRMVNVLFCLFCLKGASGLNHVLQLDKRHTHQWSLTTNSICLVNVALRKYVYRSNDIVIAAIAHW